MPYVGVFGGTFDPIHYGHLAAAEGLIHAAGLDQVIFLPNRQPPHKAGRPVSSATHRAAMVRLAIEGNPRFGYSALELERDGLSYTIDTVRAFRTGNPGWRLAFIIGMDSLLEIETWKDYRELLTLTDLLVANRPGYPTASGEAVLDRLGPDLAGRVAIFTLPGVAVSATQLRQRVATGGSLRYLVPERVCDYVLAHKLYQT